MDSTGVTRSITMRRPGPVRPPADTGGWVPMSWLGAPAPGGLALPSAQPDADTLYAPRGVWLEEDLLVVADTGNHRVMIWHVLTGADHRPADVLLGQATWTDEGPQAAGAGPAGGMNLPTGVLVHDGALIVCDAWNHRLLVWDEVPQQTCTPDHVIGQPDHDSVSPNAGGEADATTLYWPFGAAFVAGGFWIADTGNRRVLGWRDGLPLDGRGADVVLGQPDSCSREENRGAAASSSSFRWPHDLVEYRGGLLIADAGNHRLLGWRCPPSQDRPADLVIGQPDFESATEFPYAPQDGAGLRFPYALAASGDELFVADTANNRILGWPDGVGAGSSAATIVLGQPDLCANGENRWQQVAADTLCWPYGLDTSDTMIAVADSGNNRVMLWRRG